MKHHFITGEFSQNPNAIDDKIAKTKYCSLKIRDPAYGERSSYLGQDYYAKNIRGYVIVFHLTNQESFNNVKSHFQTIDRYAYDRAVKILDRTKKKACPIQ